MRNDGPPGKGPPDNDGPPGKGPPDSFPGKGRSKADVPGNAPIEKVKDKFSSILENSTGEGRMTMRVLDSNGDEKERLESIRVKGSGSVELRAFEENGNQKWGLKRKDKLPHNKLDKLE